MAGLDILEKRKISLSCRGSKLDSSSNQEPSHLLLLVWFRSHSF